MKGYQLVFPAVIICGAIGIAAYLFVWPSPPTPPQEQPTQAAAARVPDIRPTDHIRGNPAAPVVIIEYSDTECPFCKEFHTVLKQVMQTYGVGGQVAWVYREFPIVANHRKAPHEAEAAECVAHIAGEDTFWKYIDAIYAETPSNDGLPEATLIATATQLGVATSTLQTCIASHTTLPLVQQSIAEADRAGASGTPYTVIEYQGEQLPVEGLQSFEAMKNTIDILTSPAATTTS